MVEGKQHLELKKAVKQHLSQGNYCHYESHMWSWGGKGSLRVDVHYVKNKRHYYVECETAPRLERLITKGEKRRKRYLGSLYNLIVPATTYNRIDWWRLSGYFDIIYFYSFEREEVVSKIDLRYFGGLRDLFLDLVTPIFRGQRAQDFYRSFWKRKNILKKCIQCLSGSDDQRSADPIRPDIQQVPDRSCGGRRPRYVRGSQR